MPRTYEKASSLSIRTDCGWNEQFVKDEIARDPTILNLGDLTLLQKERKGPHGARLDLLFCDESNASWYEVELQLGTTDPSHIVRTIEYWDTERRRHPEYTHTAVIIAEEIDGRYFNVINLFSQQIPLLAIKMSAIAVGDKATLMFTTVLDFLPKSKDARSRDFTREYWEDRTSASSMQAVDEIVNMAKSIDPAIKLGFGKHDIFLYDGGSCTSFRLWPKKRLLEDGTCF